MKKEFRFFTIAQYEDEEKYLSEMHSKGYKFVKVVFPGIYYFEECEPENVIYKLDYNPNRRKDFGEYLKMYEDCGWDYILEFVGYSYFRKKASDANTDEEVLTDYESKLDMAKYVLKKRLTPLLFIFCLIIIPQICIQFNYYSRREDVSSLVLGITFIVLLLVYLTVFYEFYKYYRRVKEKQLNG